MPICEEGLLVQIASNYISTAIQVVKNVNTIVISLNIFNTLSGINNSSSNIAVNHKRNNDNICAKRTGSFQTNKKIFNINIFHSLVVGKKFNSRFS